MSEHVELQIIATEDDTEIWLGDDEGHFVAKAVGGMVEGLLPGEYVVSFGLKGRKYPITLTEPAAFLQRELEVDADMDEMERQAGGEPLEADPAYDAGERSDYIEDTNSGTDDVYRVERELYDLGAAFLQTGNPQVGRRLLRYSETLAEARRKVNRAMSRELNRQVKQAQENSGLLLKSALAGIAIADGETDES